MFVWSFRSISLPPVSVMEFSYLTIPTPVALADRDNITASITYAF